MPKVSDMTARGAAHWTAWTMLWAAAMTASAAISLYWSRSGILEGAANRLIGVFAIGALMLLVCMR